MQEKSCYNNYYGYFDIEKGFVIIRSRTKNPCRSGEIGRRAGLKIR